MTDAFNNTLKRNNSGLGRHLFLRDEDLRQSIELLFYAYRDFTSDPDSILKDFSMGRAHHRVLHFISRNPGITVNALLDILRITKQSLNRVLSQLIDDGYVEQQTGKEDRRRRHLYLTDKGASLEKQLADPQKTRFMRAFREAGPEAVAGFRQVLVGLVDEEDRADILQQMDSKS